MTFTKGPRHGCKIKIQQFFWPIPKSVDNQVIIFSHWIACWSDCSEKLSKFFYVISLTLLLGDRLISFAFSLHYVTNPPGGLVWGCLVVKRVNWWNRRALLFQNFLCRRIRRFMSCLIVPMFLIALFEDHSSVNSEKHWFYLCIEQLSKIIIWAIEMWWINSILILSWQWTIKSYCLHLAALCIIDQMFNAALFIC